MGNSFRSLVTNGNMIQKLLKYKVSVLAEMHDNVKHTALSKHGNCFSMRYVKTKDFDVLNNSDVRKALGPSENPV